MPIKESIFPNDSAINSGSDKQAMLAALRQRIRHLESSVAWRQGDQNSHIHSPVISLGVFSIDASLPGGGLYAHCLNEVVASDASGLSQVAARASASGFAAFLLARLAGHTIEGRQPSPVLWCCKRKTRRGTGDLYAPGMATYGLDHERLLIARGLRPQEVLWAMEEGLSSGALAAVIGEPGVIDPVALRRLQLTAKAGRKAAILLLSERALLAATPAHTRWRISPLPLPAIQDHRAASFPNFHWRVELLKCRGGSPAEWTLNEDDLDLVFSYNSLEHPHGIIPTPTPGAVPLAGGLRHRPVPQTMPSTASDGGLRHTG